MIDRCPKGVIRFRVTNCQHKLWVDELRAVYLSCAVVGVTRAPHVCPVVVDMVGDLDYQISTPSPRGPVRTRSSAPGCSRIFPGVYHPL